jgi:23S rRNA (pseudouridine1915-N3)-methyltransferase
MQLSAWLAERRSAGARVSFVIGGPDGLDEAIGARAQLRWSLSALTFPHALVRVLLAEQLYRASTVLAGHPYHRA